MKLVIDTSIAEKWYVSAPDTAKALRLRLDFHAQLHELLAPETLLAVCTEIVVNAEKKKFISPGKAATSIQDLLLVGLDIRLCGPLLRRAAEISFLTRLKVVPCLYLALAEQEQCQLLTADQRVLRATSRHFSSCCRSRTCPDVLQRLFKYSPFTSPRWTEYVRNPCESVRINANLRIVD